MSAFQERYELLDNEELINIALTTELMPEAEVALHAVLSSRGINDLSAYRTILHDELTFNESNRQKKLKMGKSILRWRTWAICAISLITIIYGIYLVLEPSKARPGDDGSFMIMLGIAGVLFAFILERVDIFWNKHVLLRRPPTRLR